MEPADEGETVDAGRRREPEPPAPGERLYLLALVGNTSAVHPLPPDGAVSIGRSPDAGVVVDDPSVSRQHAEVLLERGAARIADLGSHNGVRVNGEPVTGSRPLQSGDVISLGDASLVFHRGERPRASRPLLGAAALRDRLAEEAERVIASERGLSVIAVDPGPGGALASELAAALDGTLRLFDLVGQDGGALVLVLPELAGDEAGAFAEQVLHALAPLAKDARAGVSSAPEDGLNAQALLAAARSAALAATARSVQASGPASHRIALGERTVLVADPSMVKLYELLRRLAASTIPVLIHGETGSGKENAAWAIHHWSSRSGGPFVALNCAALPEALADSELFGHERGAFTGADRARAGRIEQSHGGTLFLDEVAELPPPIQAKLLRALDQKRIARLGDSREREVDLRVVAATHRVLAGEVKAGRFREDLFFRLNAAQVVLPPLRDRPCELPQLCSAFLAEASARQNRPPPHLSAEAMAAISSYAWPGNVRELKNVMELLAAVTPGSIVEASHLPFVQPSPLPAPAPPASGAPFRGLTGEMRQLERRRMCEALAAAGGVQKRAAELIAMPLRTFAFKMKKHGISPRDWQPS